MERTRIHTRHVLAKAMVIGAIALLPIGISVAPAIAAPIYPANHSWQRDCDHDGPWQWQQNRGNWEFGNCNNQHGHWEWRGDRGDWRWHRDVDAPAPTMSFFGSM